nr:MAG TPA: protein of unknown function (DUF5531) [Caudoviricetes sp.]
MFSYKKLLEIFYIFLVLLADMIGKGHEKMPPVC